jgi:hypothetical protein
MEAHIVAPKATMGLEFLTGDGKRARKRRPRQKAAHNQSSRWKFFSPKDIVRNISSFHGHGDWEWQKSRMSDTVTARSSWDCDLFWKEASNRKFSVHWFLRWSMIT